MTRTIFSIRLIVLLAIVPSIHAQELVKDIRPGPNGSFPRALVQVNNRFFFQAKTPEFGTELWVSDGSSAGTRMVLDIAPGEASSRAEPLVTIFNTLFFNTVEPAAIWRTNGTEAGTLKLAEFGSGFARQAWVLGGLVFFTYHPTNGSQLWYTDGTSAGTHPVGVNGIGIGRQIFGQVGDVAVFRGSLYFTTLLSDNKGALWKISPSNMIPEKVISDELTHPLSIHAGSNQLYILGAQSQFVLTLWVSDGTTDGTQFVAEFTGGTKPSDARIIGSNGDDIYFLADDGVHGREPWVSDGTPEGTLLLKDINPGSARSVVWDGIAYEDRFFFATSNDEFGSELWITDGTSEGTWLFRDINPGPDGSGVSNLVVVDDRIVFRAEDGIHGRELWMTAGAPSKTAMIADLNPGADDSMPTDMLQIGDFLYFSAEHADYGNELWKLDLTAVSVANERQLTGLDDLSVFNAYPNPFRTETTLEYEIPTASDVRIVLYNMLGQSVNTLFSGYRAAGLHSLSVDAGNLVSGVYFVRIYAGSFVKSRKLMIIR